MTVGKVTRVAASVDVPGLSSPASHMAMEKAAAATARPISIQDSDERKSPKRLPEEKLKLFIDAPLLVSLNES